MVQEQRDVIECPHCKKIQFAKSICCMPLCRKPMDGAKSVDWSPTKKEVDEAMQEVERKQDHLPVKFGYPLPSIDTVQMALIHEAIKRCGGNKLAASRQIGMGKTTIYRLLKEEKKRNDRAMKGEG